MCTALLGHGTVHIDHQLQKCLVHVPVEQTGPFRRSVFHLHPVKIDDRTLDGIPILELVLVTSCVR